MSLTVDPVARQYLVRALAELAIPCPARYQEMLDQIPPGKAIPNLYPRWFLPNPEANRASDSAVAGRPVIPFAQAIGYDLIACFLVEPSVTYVE